LLFCRPYAEQLYVSDFIVDMWVVEYFKSSMPVDIGSIISLLQAFSCMLLVKKNCNNNDIITQVCRHITAIDVQDLYIIQPVSAKS
jgi:hypothetical protein